MDYVRDNCRKSSISSFIAGALLPTIAYFLLTRLPGKKKAIEENNMTNIGDECDDDSANSSDFDETDGFIITETGEDPQKWGMKDAPYKMVLCVNQELKMGKGKVAAQCSHAAVGCYKRSMKSSPSGVRAWEDSGCAKIAVKCPLEDEMINSILPKAAQAGIPYCLIEDAGRTQIAAGSRTVLGLGPAPVRCFEGVTSHLKLM